MIRPNELFRNPQTGEWFDRQPDDWPWGDDGATNLCDLEAAWGVENEPEPRERLGKRPEQMDGQGSRAGGYRQWGKRQQHRVERRRARRNPECAPGYRKHKGWEI